MSAIKNIFKNIVGERLLTSYDFLDIAKGKAIQFWYGLKTRTTYVMNEFALYSDDIETTHQNYTCPSSDAKLIDIDFDVTFDKPQIIEGTIIANTVHGIISGGGNCTGTCTSYIIAKIRKWDGTTETNLATKQSASITVTESGSFGNHTHKISALELEISRTKFRKGDVIRLTVEQWASTTGALGGASYWRVGFGHDPKTRNSPTGIISAGEPTTITMTVPFKIDI